MTKVILRKLVFSLFRTMPVKSYLLFPHTGRESDLLESLLQYSNCEVFPSDRKEVFVLVSETQSEQEDEALLQKLECEKDVHHIQFISGFLTDTYETERV